MHKQTNKHTNTQQTKLNEIIAAFYHSPFTLFPMIIMIINHFPQQNTLATNQITHTHINKQID